ncbi:MAG: LptF/LptG family permease [bacterium]
MKILDRYIIREFFPSFFLGLFIFGFILIMNRLIIFTDLLLVPGVTLKIIGQLLWYLFLPFIMFIVPLSILFTSIMLFGRLIHDNEFLALKGCGVNPVRIFVPILFFGLISTIILLLLGFDIIPQANRSFRSLLFRLSKQNIAMALEEKKFNEYGSRNTVFFDKVLNDKNLFQGIVVADHAGENSGQVLFAQKGEIRFDNERQELLLYLKQGNIHPLKLDQSLSSYRLLSFGEYDFGISLTSPQLNKLQKKDKEMSIEELSYTIAQKGLELREIKSYRLEWHRRFAFPAACLIFAFLGPAIGLWSKWPGKGSSFALSIVILLLYYIIMTIGTRLLYAGYLPVYVAAWLPNGVLLGIAAGLIKKIVRV